MAKTKRVLIIDDDEEDIDILAHHLENCAEVVAEIVTANTQDDAVELLQDGVFDAVFIDYRLGGQQKGTEIFDQIQDLPEHTRLILCSGNEEGFMDQAAMKRMRSGEMRFISKRSINPQELREILVE